MHISTDTGPHYNPMMPIDTLAVAKRLQSAGIPKEQAEMQAEVLGEIITQNLASKTDIENLRKDSKADTENVRKDIEMLRKDTEILRRDLTIEIEKIKSDLMKWIIPLMAVQLAATAGFSNFLLTNLKTAIPQVLRSKTIATQLSTHRKR